MKLTKNKKVLAVTAVVIVVLLAVAGVIGYSAYDRMYRQSWIQRDCTLYVRHNATRADILTQLADMAGADTGSVWLDIASQVLQHNPKASKTDISHRDISGAYRFAQGTPLMTVLKRLCRHQQDPVRLTFIGTRTLPELAGRLALRLEADSTSLLSAMYDPTFLTACGCDSNRVACYLLPDTYEVYWNVSPSDLMQRLLAEYRRFWTDERKARADSLGLTPEEVSIICSIAEEETANRRERGTVARLYWNRLQKGMPLQADPTVKYAVGDFTLRRITHDHLKTESPYNTYLHPGLPPGPIRVVDKATIDTFLSCPPHRWLYMCAKEDFCGLHNFAATLTEHNRNAARYHKALKAKGVNNKD